MRLAKNWVICVAAVLAALPVAACNVSGSDADGKPQVLVLVPSVESAAYIRMIRGAKAEVENHPDVDISIQAGTSRGESTNLVAKIESALTRGVDVIAVSSGAVGEQLIPALDRAISQGVEVVTFDQDIPDIDRASFISIDIEKAGQQVGRYMGEALNGEGEIGVLQCFADNAVMKKRDEGFLAGLESTGPDVEVVSWLDAECDLEKARTATENLLTAHPDLDGLFSNTDLELQGALPALKRAGVDPVVVGYDGDPPIIERIAAGDTIDATVTNPFERYGKVTVQKAVQLANGESIPEFVEIPSELVTQDNAKEVLAELRKYRA